MDGVSEIPFAGGVRSSLLGEEGMYKYHGIQLHLMKPGLGLYLLGVDK
jgi:hypothetical protein